VKLSLFEVLVDIKVFLEKNLKGKFNTVSGLLTVGFLLAIWKVEQFQNFQSTELFSLHVEMPPALSLHVLPLHVQFWLREKMQRVLCRSKFEMI